MVGALAQPPQGRRELRTAPGERSDPVRHLAAAGRQPLQAVIEARRGIGELVRCPCSPGGCSCPSCEARYRPTPNWPSARSTPAPMPSVGGIGLFPGANVLAGEAQLRFFDRALQPRRIPDRFAPSSSAAGPAKLPRAALRSTAAAHCSFGQPVVSGVHRVLRQPRAARRFAGLFARARASASASRPAPLLAFVVPCASSTAALISTPEAAG